MEFMTDNYIQGSCTQRSYPHVDWRGTLKSDKWNDLHQDHVFKKITDHQVAAPYKIIVVWEMLESHQCMEADLLWYVHINRKLQATEQVSVKSWSLWWRTPTLLWPTSAAAMRSRPSVRHWPYWRPTHPR